MRRLLARREREGLTLAELARRARIPVGTLAWWSSRLRRQEAESSVGFVELKPEAGVARGLGGDCRLEVVLACDRRVLVPPGFDAIELQRLVRALES